MTLYLIDWAIVLAFFAVVLIIGVISARQSAKGFNAYFLSGRNMPWWLLGVSMVATTFSADTPNLVTDIVRNHGVAGNWSWWAFLLTGMLTTFVYARLWRRSGVATDLEFYELRYSGKPAAFLRGFRAIYLGVFFNVMIMATVLLAGIKLGAVFLGLKPFASIFWISLITLIYSLLGGFRGVVLSDFLQFILALTGAVFAAYVALNHPNVGGLDGLMSSEKVKPLLPIIPDFSDWENALLIFILPLTVQWWSVWYPGSEPGGGGYVAQRILASKTETDASKAATFFNLAHYAIRPWPWILVALCSVLVYPDLESLRQAFPELPDHMIQNDLAYPAMLRLLPAGWAGLVLASLAAALMSTISTHLNWGSSYLVKDFYSRFINMTPSGRQEVWIGRISTLSLMSLSVFVALLLSNALEAFNILLQIGAGTGLLFILRWFWIRINPWSEITAMVVSFLVAVYFQFVHSALGLEEFPISLKLVVSVVVTTLAWVLVTLFTTPSDKETLDSFENLTNPGGPGWGNKGSWFVPGALVSMLLGTLSIYGILFSTGWVIYGNYLGGLAGLAFSILGFTWVWKRENSD